MHVNQVQQLIEESLRHYDIQYTEWYRLPWSLNRNTNKLRPLKETGFLPAGRSGRHAKQLSAEQIGYIIIAALLGSCDREQVIDKVKVFAGLKLVGEKNIKLTLLQRLEIILGDPNEAAKVDRLTVEQTFPYAVIEGDTGREVYTLDGDETKIPPVTGSGMTAYMGHSTLVALAQGLQPKELVPGVPGRGWVADHAKNIEEYKARVAAHRAGASDG